MTSDHPDPRPSAGRSALPLARLRIGLIYAWRHRRIADLSTPRRFTELVQLRKLRDRSPFQTQLMDKLAAKRLVADRLGGAWLVPTLWEGTALPARPPFEFPAILKARHGCNQNVVLCREPGTLEWDRLRRRVEKWLRSPYGMWLDEWAYRDVPRGAFAEPLLGGGLPLPIDYKIYVFGGRATHIQVHLGRGARHRWILHDLAWRRLVPGDEHPPPPPSLAAMIDAAEELARDTSFLRVDFYDIAGRPYFGEFCLYPGSGFDPFPADWIDFELGSIWLAALGAAAQSLPVTGSPTPISLA
jgi:hypothetical protein